MDTASFSISVVSLAIQVFNAVSDSYSSLQNTNDLRNPLADMVDLQVQQCRFISWAKTVGLTDERLSQFGDPFIHQTVLNVLCQMLQLLQDAVSPGNKYGLVFHDPNVPLVDPLQSSPQVTSSPGQATTPLDMRDSASALTFARPETVQALLIQAQASFSVFRDFHWKISDRNLFQNLIRRLKEKNDNLESLFPRPVQITAVEMGETTLLQSDDVKYLKCIAQVASKSWISLAQSANFKSNYIDSDESRDIINHAEFIPRTRLALDNLNEESRTLATYEFDGLGSKRVYVEWKRVGVLKSAISIAESERVILDRIKRLVVILACPTDASFRSLACLGYTTTVSGRIGLVFKLPDSAAKACPSVSLHDILRKPDQTKPVVPSSGARNSKSKKPALEDRLRLAHALALSIYRLHRTGVIHKHIAPANIIFFPDKSTSAVSILEPFLTGFDFAREEAMANHSEIPDSIIDGEVLYRHPSYELGKSSTKVVDIYALGILLIEIASWEPIESAKKEAEKRSVSDFREFLFSEFVESGFLAYRMGTDYQNAVKHCLEVSFDNGEQDSANILGPFYGNVVQGLMPLVS